MMIATLACANAGQAHHSISMFDVTRSIWVKGTVVRYQPINPHTLVTLDEMGTDGKPRRLIIEGPIMMRLQRMGASEDFLKPGDVISVCGFAYRDPVADGSTRPALHGHVVVMPDGKMRLFGPYGRLDNCIRPNDSKKMWADFLNADPLAREAWCRIRPMGSAEEVSKMMANPC